MIVLLAVLVALAQDGDSFAARIYAEATRLEQQGDLAAAALRYREILRLEPTWEHVRLDLGRVLEQLGDLAGAERVYAEGVGERSLQALADLLREQGRTAEAVEVHRRRADLLPASPEALVPYAAAQVADGRVQEALDTLRAYLERPGINVAQDRAIPIAIAIGEALLARMETTDATDLMYAVLAAAPEAAVETDGPFAAVEELLVRIEVDDLAAKLATAGEVPLDAEGIEELRLARADLHDGRIGDARRRLEVVAVERPRSAAVWAALASAREADGDVAGAEQALQVALAIDPLDAALHARLGDLLYGGYGGRRDREAVHAYRQAVRHDAHDAALWWRKARAERSAGEWEQAAVSAARAVALDPGAPFAREAERWVAGAGRADPSPIVLSPSTPEGPMSTEARLAFARAQAWRDRSEPYALDRALEEARRARALSPDTVATVNLEAAIHVERGESADAIASYEESLRGDASQPDVLVGLAPLYEETGRPNDAKAMWDRAAALDHPPALWRAARAQAEVGRPWAARDTLRRYFASTAGGAEYAAAQSLDRAVRARIRAWTLAGGALAATALALPLWWGVWRRTRRGLDGLLEASPSAWRDVARIVSAIRHEILRHHASPVGEVADALDNGDVESGRWLAAQWYGVPDGSALGRFDTYVAELEELGRRAGVRLALERDQVLGPLLGAMARVAALRDPLERGTRARNVVHELRALALILEDEVSPALGGLVAKLCLLEIDKQLLDDVIENVWREPTLRGEADWRPHVAPLPPGPLLVRMFRADLGDVLANLLRNAVEATRGLPQPRVGIAVGLDADPITCLERVEIRVQDSSPRRLSTSTVRGRFVGRGLGLAVDLTTRAGGSIAVEDERAWGKAVVVRLPRAEQVEP